MEHNIQIRLAKDPDATQIQQIYRPYVEETAITFEYQVPSVQEFKARIRKVSEMYPYLICEIGGKMAGYAYAARQRERAAYQWNAELSVYLKQDYHHFGIGKALYNALIEILKLQNMQNLYGGITLPNTKSEQLHKSFGFTKAGIMHKTGYKHGSWHDVIWYEKRLHSDDGKPEPLLSVHDVPEDKVYRILEDSLHYITLRR